MLRVLQTLTMAPNFIRAAAPLAVTPIWKSSGFNMPQMLCRTMAQKNKSDSEDDILPEGRKTQLRKKTGLSSQTPVRSYLDVIKYVPILDHFLLLTGQNIVTMSKAEYDVFFP